jgi:CBS-domain-containing membrane protein
LADAEGFASICFALEALGTRLLQKKGDLGKYRAELSRLATDSVVLAEIARGNPGYFGSFNSLFDLVQNARNDAMHSGVYARHATAAAIELCIALEEALMKEQDVPRTSVEDFMVKSPVTVEPWQLVAHARQLMLTHSFSFLPIYIDEEWNLLSEVAMAKYLRSGGTWKTLLALPIEAARAKGLLHLQKARVVDGKALVADLLAGHGEDEGQVLWLVQERSGRLSGVLSPFELM